MAANLKFKKLAGQASAPKKTTGVAALDPPGTTYIQVDGQTVKVPSGMKYVPGSAGVHTPTIQPFQTSSDMMQSADENFNLGQGLSDLDKSFADMKTNVDYEKTQVNKSEVNAKNTTIDNMIARGLGQSSIRDGEIYDIQATATMRRNFLDTTLGAAEIALGTNKGRLQKRAEDIQKAMSQKAIENAQQANDGTPDYVPGQEPTAGGLVQAAPGAKSPAKAAVKAPVKATAGIGVQNKFLGGIPRR